MLKKALRTIQSSVPGTRRLKNEAYYRLRRTLRVPHERDFRHLRALPAREDDLFLDIGGNWGQSIMAMRLVRPDTPIVSFEPLPFMFAEIERRFAADPKLTLHNCALGAVEASATFYTPVYNGFVYDGLTSSDRRSAETWLSPETMFLFNPSRLRIEESRCAIRTLDSFGLAPSFIKIDVQGMEEAVIAGGEHTIRQHQPTLMLERDEREAAVAGRLRSLGYMEVVPNGTTFVPGTRESMNAFWMTEQVLRSLPIR